MTIEFGALSLSDLQRNNETGTTATAADRIDEIIGYGMLAERLGLDVFALGEHHTLDFAVSSPAVVLAAIAARTSIHSQFSILNSEFPRDSRLRSMG